MKRNLMIISMFLLTVGCQSRATWEDLHSVATLASEKTAKNIHHLFENRYEIRGIVVKVEDHPISAFSSTGIHNITYHVEHMFSFPFYLSADFARTPIKATSLGRPFMSAGACPGWGRYWSRPKDRNRAKDTSEDGHDIRITFYGRTSGCRCGDF